MKFVGSLPPLQDPATGPCPKLEEASSHSHYPRLSACLEVFQLKFCISFHLPMRATWSVYPTFDWKLFLKFTRIFGEGTACRLWCPPL